LKLQTERVSFKALSLTDLENIHALLQLPETDEFNTLGIPETIHATEKIISAWMDKINENPPAQYVFCLERRDSNQFIGIVGLNLRESKFSSAEAWFKIQPVYWKQGFATEVLIRILEFGFDHLHLHRIEAGCATGNLASVRVMEKAGMIREGTKRKILPIRGE
jgi:ribosomal-protein-alanine N-acetyltransferase